MKILSEEWETLTGKYNEIRGAVVRIMAGRADSSFLRRP